MNDASEVTWYATCMRTVQCREMRLHPLCPSYRLADEFLPNLRALVIRMLLWLQCRVVVCTMLLVCAFAIFLPFRSLSLRAVALAAKQLQDTRPSARE